MHTQLNIKTKRDDSGELYRFLCFRELKYKQTTHHLTKKSEVEMADNALYFKNPNTGETRKAPVGFSWSSILFNVFMVSLFRRDFKNAGIYIGYQCAPFLLLFISISISGSGMTESPGTLSGSGMTESPGTLLSLLPPLLYVHFFYIYPCFIVNKLHIKQLVKKSIAISSFVYISYKK